MDGDRLPETSLSDRLVAFLEGARSAFVVSPPTMKLPSINKALADDWAKVFGDIRIAAGKMLREHEDA